MRCSRPYVVTSKVATRARGLTAGRVRAVRLPAVPGLAALAVPRARPLAARPLAARRLVLPCPPRAAGPATPPARATPPALVPPSRVGPVARVLARARV